MALIDAIIEIANQIEKDFGNRRLGASYLRQVVKQLRIAVKAAQEQAKANVPVTGVAPPLGVPAVGGIIGPDGKWHSASYKPKLRQVEDEDDLVMIDVVGSPTGVTMMALPKDTPVGHIVVIEGKKHSLAKDRRLYCAEPLP